MVLTDAFHTIRRPAVLLQATYAKPSPQLVVQRSNKKWLDGHRHKSNLTEILKGYWKNIYFLNQLLTMCSGILHDAYSLLPKLKQFHFFLLSNCGAFQSRLIQNELQEFVYIARTLLIKSDQTIEHPDGFQAIFPSLHLPVNLYHSLALYISCLHLHSDCQKI